MLPFENELLPLTPEDNEDNDDDEDEEEEDDDDCCDPLATDSTLSSESRDGCPAAVPISL